MERVKIEITEEQARELLLPHPCEYWITAGRHPSDSATYPDKIKFEIHGIIHDPITREGIEGLGFEYKRNQEWDLYKKPMDKESTELIIEITYNFGIKIRLFYPSDLSEKVIFLGKLETMKQLKDVLKWTGVL